MKHQSTFFFGLTGIKLSLASSPGLDLGNGLRVLNDKNSIGRLVSSYVEFIGTVEEAFLVHRAQAVGYRRLPIELDENQISESINGELIRSLVEVTAWLTRLWMIKDNSVDVDSGWMAVPVKNSLQVSTNRLSVSVTKADGSMENTFFSASEIEKARSIPVEADYWKSTGPIPLAIELGQDPSATKLSGDSLRFYRFTYYLHTGRTTSDVPLKIAHWCSALEALVSSSQTELSHQVAERVASGLHEIGYDRLNTFKLVKHAYGIRSKAVHGAAFKNKDVANLKDTAVALDDVCRHLARLYLESEDFREAIERSSPQFDQYWLKRLLVDGAAST